MIFDFQLGENGDILFKQSSREKESLQFDFFTANTNGLVFNFYIDSYNNKEYLADLKPHFELDFYIDNPEDNKEIVCIDNKEDYIYQQIKIRLNSALGTIRNNETLGSKLDNYRHMLLNPDKHKGYEELILCIRDAIKDILPNAGIDIYNTPSIYTDFTNSLVVMITQDDLNYYYYL